MSDPDDRRLDGFEHALDEIRTARLKVTLSILRDVMASAPGGDRRDADDGMAVIGLAFTGLTAELDDGTGDETLRGAAAAVLIFESLVRKGGCTDAEAAASMLAVVAALPAPVRARAAKIGRILPEGL